MGSQLECAAEEDCLFGSPINCTGRFQKMGQFVAKMGHKAICNDISNIMKIVIMVAVMKILSNSSDTRDTDSE